MTLSDVREWALQARPVFICGPERSGTSILYKALAKSDELFNLSDVYETFVFLEPRRVLADPVPTMLKQYLRGQENVAAFRDFADKLECIDDTDLARAFFWFAQKHVYIGRRPLEKTPRHVFAIDKILEAFPCARIIICTRSPIDIVTSYRRRLASERLRGAPQSEWQWLDKTVDQLIGHLRQITRHVEDATAKPRRGVMIVPYGLLTGYSSVALDEICKHAEIRFDPRMLNAGAGNASNEADILLSKPIELNPSKAREYLSEEEIDKLGRFMTQVAGTWGLETFRYSPEISKGPR